MIFVIVSIFSLLKFLDAACPTGTLQGQTPNTCYLLNSTLVVWFEAEIFCEQRGGHLTSILGAFENQLVLGIAEASITNSDDYWIGGDNNKEFIPGYVGNWVWTDGSEFKYNNWASGKPPNDTTYCGSLHKTSGSWYAQSCTLTKPFICKLPEVAVIPSCPSDWTYYAVTKSCYKVLYSPNFMDPPMAKKYCEGFNSTLASIHSPQENYFVVGMTTVLTRDTYPNTNDLYTYNNYPVIGLIADGKQWSWLDGSNVDFINWSPSSGTPTAGNYAFIETAINEAYYSFWVSSNPVDIDITRSTAICKKSAFY